MKMIYRICIVALLLLICAACSFAPDQITSTKQPTINPTQMILVPTSTSTPGIQYVLLPEVSSRPVIYAGKETLLPFLPDLGKVTEVKLIDSNINEVEEYTKTIMAEASKLGIGNEMYLFELSGEGVGFNGNGRGFLPVFFNSVNGEGFAAFSSNPEGVVLGGMENNIYFWKIVGERKIDSKEATFGLVAPKEVGLSMFPILEVDGQGKLWFITPFGTGERYLIQIEQNGDGSLLSRIKMLSELAPTAFIIQDGQLGAYDFIDGNYYAVAKVDADNLVIKENGEIWAMDDKGRPVMVIRQKEKGFEYIEVYWQSGYAGDVMLDNVHYRWDGERGELVPIEQLVAEGKAEAPEPYPIEVEDGFLFAESRGSWACPITIGLDVANKNIEGLAFNPDRADAEEQMADFARKAMYYAWQQNVDDPQVKMARQNVSFEQYVDMVEDYIEGKRPLADVAARVYVNLRDEKDDKLLPYDYDPRNGFDGVYIDREQSASHAVVELLKIYNRGKIARVGMVLGTGSKLTWLIDVANSHTNAYVTGLTVGAMGLTSSKEDQLSRSEANPRFIQTDANWMNNSYLGKEIVLDYIREYNMIMSFVVVLE